MKKRDINPGASQLSNLKDKFPLSFGVEILRDFSVVS